MRHASLALLAIALSAGCATAVSPGAHERGVQLNAIADKCGIPRSAFKLRADDELQFNPPAITTYKAVDCALVELKRTSFPLKLGFVGNEAPAEPEEK